MKKNMIILVGLVVLMSSVCAVAMENSMPIAFEKLHLEKVINMETNIPVEVGAIRAVSFQSGTKFACMSAESNILFNLDIVDVGDEEGQVVINDGGAPKTFNADYSSGRFVFGDDYESSIEIPVPGYFEWVVGRVNYKGKREKLICQYGEIVNQSIPASLGSNSAFSCIGTHSERMYDLDIVDVGDDEGEFVINDGGAPEILKIYYNNGRFIFGKSLIELNQPSWYDWTTGKAFNVNGLSEPLVCKSVKYN